MPDISLDAHLFATTFVTVLVIMDPIGNIPIFLALTKGQTTPQRHRSALVGASVAAGVIIAFAIFGRQVLDLLGISLEALQVAGGLLLLLIALELLHPNSDASSSIGGNGKTNVALVPLGTPLLAGPGAIAATMLYAGKADDLGGVISVGLAIIAVLLVIYLTLRYASGLATLLRDNGIELLSKVMGLLVAAIAVQLVAQAIEVWVKNGVA